MLVLLEEEVISFGFNASRCTALLSQRKSNKILSKILYTYRFYKEYFIMDKLYILRLLACIFLLTGAKTKELPMVFSSVGGHAMFQLSSGNTSNCTSVTWLQHCPGSIGQVVEVVSQGKITAEHKHKADRLSLDSHCSLHIANVSREDAGMYLYGISQGMITVHKTCAYLFVLYISAFPSQTVSTADYSVTLHCALHPQDVCERKMKNSEEVQLSWLGKEEPKKDHFCPVGESPQCHIILTEQLEQPDGETWTCQLTAGDEVKASVTYPVKISKDMTCLSDAPPSKIYVV
ncbi:uncharacterized protein LOC134098460 isoform X2 [Sardina pilchardus]|uniref:uncharacterized protein LOC134098460 isoform X2 n=1 Tax=Sardina pilchardus TaxID=27697 RepID=UPI002E10A110